MSEWETRTIQCPSCSGPIDLYVPKDKEVTTCDPIGIHTSSESPEQFHYALTVNVTKSVRLSLAAIVESDPQDTTEAQQVWRDVASALGELQMWLLGPATPTASRSTRS